MLIVLMVQAGLFVQMYQPNQMLEQKSDLRMSFVISDKQSLIFERDRNPNRPIDTGDAAAPDKKKLIDIQSSDSIRQSDFVQKIRDLGSKKVDPLDRDSKMEFVILESIQLIAYSTFVFANEVEHRYFQQAMLVAKWSKSVESDEHIHVVYLLEEIGKGWKLAESCSFVKNWFEIDGKEPGGEEFIVVLKQTRFAGREFLYTHDHTNVICVTTCFLPKMQSLHDELTKVIPQEQRDRLAKSYFWETGRK